MRASLAQDLGYSLEQLNELQCAGSGVDNSFLFMLLFVSKQKHESDFYDRT